MNSPSSGDWVKALIDERNPRQIEGVLHLRLVPLLNYVQVNVIEDGDGHVHSVNPDSIEVLRPGAVNIADLEADELIGDKGWRRIADLNQAHTEGLITRTRIRRGGSWDDMFERLQVLSSPLIGTGWKRFDSSLEDSWEYGDSVSNMLEREGTSIELEYYEQARLVAYSHELSDEEANGGEPTPPFFVLYEVTPESCREAFQDQGWLDPPSPRSAGT